jgi:hypothetical protein
VGSASVEAFPKSGKVPDTHSVGAICDHNLGVFTVTEDLNGELWTVVPGKCAVRRVVHTPIRLRNQRRFPGFRLYHTPR